MTTNHPKISVEAARSTLRAAGSTALAQALICGIDLAIEEGSTITQNDRIHLATMAIMAYDGILRACDEFDIEVNLQTLRDFDES